MVWYFIGVYIINRTLHGRLEIQNFSSRVEKIFHSLIFFNTRREILYLCAAMLYPLYMLRRKPCILIFVFALFSVAVAVSTHLCIICGHFCCPMPLVQARRLSEFYPKRTLACQHACHTITGYDRHDKIMHQ